LNFFFFFFACKKDYIFKYVKYLMVNNSQKYLLPGKSNAGLKGADSVGMFNI